MFDVLISVSALDSRYCCREHLHFKPGHYNQSPELQMADGEYPFGGTGGDSNLWVKFFSLNHSASDRVIFQLDHAPDTCHHCYLNAIGAGCLLLLRI
jgi:hypothetical protein